MAQAVEPSGSESVRMQEDTTTSLETIRDRYPKGLIPQLLEIQQHRAEEPKWLEWARNPLCLRRVSQKPNRKRTRGEDSTQVSHGSRVFRRVPRHREHYVAVSYTSQCSEQESEAVGGFHITDSAQDKSATPTKVRDCILERVVKYAEHHGVDLIWIDDECINRGNSDEHEMAMQSMDLIYSFSKYPVGLLTKPIESSERLLLLQGLLHSGFIETSNGRGYPELKPEISANVASKVVDLLDYITSDKWWTRAWIFQEAYRSSVKMNLLIPHSPCLSGLKSRNYWRNIPGELQVKSADFHEQSTLFCLAFLRKVGDEWQGSHAKCRNILERARKYNVLYQHEGFAENQSARKAMSPFIINDIGNRKNSAPSDLLAIAANCCDYSVRLNTKSLGGTSCSLSIAILALYLLNGEIIMNNKDDKILLSETIFSYLHQLALDSFDPPVASKELTFIKSCRLVDVRLSSRGIVTNGRLWTLHKAINTGEFTTEAKPERGSPNGLNRFQRSRLRLLLEELRMQGYKILAEHLDDYLLEDAENRSHPLKQYKDLMAEEVVEAIRMRKTIHLGCLVGRNPYRGVFVTNSALEPPSHVFTAWCPAGSGGKASDEIHAERLLDRIVSLEVNVTDWKDPPQLNTKRWINGLCFFDGDATRDVVFNYPLSLKG